MIFIIAFEIKKDEAKKRHYTVTFVCIWRGVVYWFVAWRGVHKININLEKTSFKERLLKD